MFTPEQIIAIKSTLCDFNHFYGYTDAGRRTSGKSNTTTYFSCKEEEVDSARIDGYKLINQKTLTRVSLPHQKGMPNHQVGLGTEKITFVKEPEFT